MSEKKAFECRMCGKCCYGKGGILLTDEETDRISAFLGLNREEFLGQYCEFRNGKTYIDTGEDGFCIFFDKETNCGIHPVKPRPCYMWPLYPAMVADEENWRLAQDACPGINRECAFEDFVRESLQCRSYQDS